MEKSALKNQSELILIPDECGDTLWDAVLEPPKSPKGGLAIAQPLFFEDNDK